MHTTVEDGELMGLHFSSRSPGADAHEFSIGSPAEETHRIRNMFMGIQY